MLENYIPWRKLKTNGLHIGVLKLKRTKPVMLQIRGFYSVCSRVSAVVKPRWSTALGGLLIKWMLYWCCIGLEAVRLEGAQSPVVLMGHGAEPCCFKLKLQTSNVVILRNLLVRQRLADWHAMKTLLFKCKVEVGDRHTTIPSINSLIINSSRWEFFFNT